MSMLGAPASFVGLLIAASTHKNSPPEKEDEAQNYINNLPPAETVGKEQESPQPETELSKPTQTQPTNEQQP